MKPVDVKPNTYIALVKELTIKIKNLKLVIMLEYQNIIMFLQKASFQIGLKKLVEIGLNELLKKLK